MQLKEVYIIKSEMEKTRSGDGRARLALIGETVNEYNTESVTRKVMLLCYINYYPPKQKSSNYFIDLQADTFFYRKIHVK